MASGENLISEQQAIEFAQRGIAEHELADAAEMRDALQGATPAAAQLVHRLDRPDEFYYLVTLRRGGLATALARLDALHGHFLGAHALPEPRSSLIIDRETALQSLRGSVVDLGGELGRVPIREGAYAVYPTLVWRPCEESRSPYYPFHQVTIGGVTVYVSYDGKVHPTLHDLGRG